MDAVATVRMSGPLTCHVEGFAAELRAHGYTELSLANQLRLMSDLSRWLESRRCAVDEIDRRIVRRFLARRRRTYTQFTTERALRPLLTYLQGVDAIAVTSAPAQVRSELLQQYERYIVEERGVTSSCSFFKRDFASRSYAICVAGTSCSRRDRMCVVEAKAARNVARR